MKEKKFKKNVLQLIQNGLLFLDLGGKVRTWNKQLKKYFVYF